jgi:hypothetical protein
MREWSDENVLELPESWRRRLHPRRGGTPAPPVTVDESAVDTIAELLGSKPVRVAIGRVLSVSESDPEAVDAARGYLAGDDDPLGAAVIARIVLNRSGHHHDRLTGDDTRQLMRRFVHSWIGGPGLPFAACALAEFGRVVVNSVYRGPDDHPTVVQFLTPNQYHFYLVPDREEPRTVRALLAAAGDDQYEDAVKCLADHRVHPMQQAMASYLVPGRHDWLEECLASLAVTDYHGGWLLWCAVETPRQLELVGAQELIGWDEAEIDVLATLVDTVGSAAAPYLAEAFDENDYALQARQRKLVLQALGMLPTDEAFQLLVDRLDRKYVQAAVDVAAKRFPVRALRLLANAATATPGTSGKSGSASRDDEAAGDLLRAHVLADPELVARVLPELPTDARAKVESIATPASRPPDAPVEALPPVLAAPPWIGRRRAKPVVVTGLVPPDLRSVSWAPGEREQWADLFVRPWEADWDEQIRNWSSLTDYHQADLLIRGPEERVRPLVGRWWSESNWYRTHVLPAIAARFGLDALTLALRIAQASPATAGGLLLPFLAPEVAALQANWFKRLKTARQYAIAWFDRHGLEAAMMLVPDAAGKAGAARTNAEAALRHLAARHGDDAVIEVAGRYGDGAARAIAVMLATDPLEILPARVPKLPEWTDPRVLPPVLLRGGERALPAAAIGHLLTMLAMSRPDDPYAGIGIVRETCDRASLAEFSWALFQRWEALGAPSKENWAFTQLGLIGDDGTVDRLVPLIRDWPRQGDYARAVRALDVLAAMGTDTALLNLYDFAQKAKSGGFREQARQKIDQVAADLELTPEQLADRLVPDFGLDERGSMVLDYGPRRFTVGFDEQLRPYVLDGDGARRKALPKPGVKDDETLATAAYSRFTRLKREVRKVASDQIKRLERAMVWERRWSPGEFRRLFMDHPLIWHIVRRMVWVAETDTGTMPFRIAEDRTYADIDDEIITVPDTARIGIPHPVDLGDQVPAWSEVFADYEILQPFPQLGRPVHTLGDGERATDRLARFQSAKAPVTKVLGLQSRGWVLASPQDGGYQPWLTREIASGRHVTLDLSPGIYAGDINLHPEQQIADLYLSPAPQGGPTRPSTDTGNPTFDDLSPAAISDLLADLTDLTGTPPG